MNIRLDEMRLLVRVGSTGSMTQAARQMHLTPAAVSAAVKRIEEGLGVRLFERTTRSVHPTDEGLVLLDSCREIVARWQQTLEAVQDASGHMVGDVHLSAPADTTYQILSPLLADFAHMHPELQVVVHSSDVIHHLHRDAIDMAIRYGPLQDSGLTARKLAVLPNILVAAPTHLARHGVPRTPDDLAQHRCLTLQLSSKAESTWVLEGPHATHEVALTSPLCGDGHLARRWALAGMGVARKSLIDVIDDLESGELVRVLPDFTAGVSAIHAVFPSSRYLPARVRAVDRYLARAFAERAERCEAWLKSSPDKQRT